LEVDFLEIAFVVIGKPAQFGLADHRDLLEELRVLDLPEKYAFVGNQVGID
jgi:hypothetical protein